MSRGRYTPEVKRKQPRSDTDLDDVDLWCSTWARRRRELLGLDDRELEPDERLGLLRSTLGRVREDKVAAGYCAKVSQQFPEVYTGMTLQVHRAFSLLEGKHREVIDLNYVWFDISVPVKAREVRMAIVEYWMNVKIGKAFIRGAIIGGNTGSEEHAGAALRDRR